MDVDDAPAIDIRIDEYPSTDQEQGVGSDDAVKAKARKLRVVISDPGGGVDEEVLKGLGHVLYTTGNCLCVLHVYLSNACLSVYMPSRAHIHVCIHRYSSS